jgi:GTPase SAR1 family protein
MNLSSTTAGNKTKYKLVFLGDQSVGKSCIIEKYIHNKFDEASNVQHGLIYSQPSASTSLRRTYSTRIVISVCNYGIRQVRSASEASSRAI